MGGALQGLHTGIVELGLRSGIILFITSEVFFFLRFFWAYFHARLAPSVEIGRVWPYVGLLLTVLLGFYFTALQALEYYEASFSMADGVYGSTFFIATGFHGLHVIVGTIFLLVCLIRHLKKEFSEEHHFGFEATA